MVGVVCGPQVTAIDVPEAGIFIQEADNILHMEDLSFPIEMLQDDPDQGQVFGVINSPALSDREVLVILQIADTKTTGLIPQKW